jgi:two-component system chemotaxis sensor kinase CheA
MINDREIISEFVVESKEHLQGVENHLLAIEAAGAGADPGLINQVFRAVHSIKGAAGFLGLSTLGRLAHDMENVLNQVRDRRLVLDRNSADALLRAVDRLQNLLDDIEHSNDQDVEDHIEALQEILACRLSAVISAEFPKTPPAEAAAQPAANEVPQGPDDGPLPPAGPSPHEEECPPAASPSAARPQPAAAPAGSPAESNIRVSVTVLDRLMNLAGELVLSRNQLLQMVDAKQSRTLAGVASRLDQVTSELQETIMQARMQEIGTVFNKFPRVVRDLIGALHKQCDLRLEGTDVELDKSIIEAINDPLTHLVRNALDHGIETPEARLKAQKPARGTLVLQAFHQAGKVNIQVRDDGAGIDVGRLREKAVARGVISQEQARTMSDREALQLIFRPGFSMAERITSVSGRGVGMDVVKTNIERLGGTVAIDTQPGLGTTIQIRLPLTLAIIPSLIVRCEGQRFAIPQASIRELVRVKASEAAKRIERVQRAEVVRLRGELLPLVRLNSTLEVKDQQGPAATARAVNIIVVEAGHLRYGLIVDGLCDSEEIVVKPLGRHMKGCACLAGATILGDGRVALILDVTGIANHSHLAMPEDETSADSADADAGQETQSLLLFSNHPAEYFGVPMELVARLERIRADQIDSVGGQEVLQYRGSTLPLLGLQSYVDCKPRDPKDRLYVAVFAAAQREVGLIVPELLDIRAVPTHIDTATFREPGIIGSLVYDRMTVRLVDLHELTRKAHPDWFASQPAPQTSQGAAPRILLAEDSDFFRKQLVGFLESEGYEVHACEDGAVAWNAIQQPGNAFDLVVTDIEMPNMNGLELSRHIRDDARLADLPVIAVTSLAGEDDVERGRQVGITEYHVKLDREKLVASVRRLVQAKLSTNTARSRT